MPSFIDYHVHLYGCLTALDLWEIGKDSYLSKKARLDWYAESYEKACGIRPDYLSYWQKDDGLDRLSRDFIFSDHLGFDAFQAHFNLIIALCEISPWQMQVPEKIIRFQASQGLSTFEARTLIPFSFTASQAATYLENLCLKVSQLNSELKMQTKLVFCLFRRKEIAQKHYKWIRDFIDQKPSLSKIISGIDFAGDEKGFPPKDKNDFFIEFKKDNLEKKHLELLYHVGESFEDKSLVSAIRWIEQVSDFGANRIGHGCALGINPFLFLNHEIIENKEEFSDTVFWLKAKTPLLKDHGYEDSFLREYLLGRVKVYDNKMIEGILSLQKAVSSLFRQRKQLIEVCPSSNKKMLGLSDWKDHPMIFFSRESLFMLIGSDDPGIFATSIKQEIKLFEKHAGSSIKLLDRRV